MTDPKSREAEAGARRARRPWADHWLLEAFQRLGHPAVERLSGVQAGSAWEALEQAGATPAQLLETACALSSRDPADLAGTGPALAQLLVNSARTDLSFEDLALLGCLGPQIGDNIQSWVIDGPMVVGSRLADGAQVLLPQMDAILPVLEQFNQGE